MTHFTRSMYTSQLLISSLLVIVTLYQRRYFCSDITIDIAGISRNNRSGVSDSFSPPVVLLTSLINIG